jgi:polar amino acid transport system substrate-binding protein
MFISSGLIVGMLSLFPTPASAATYKLVTFEYPPYEYSENGQAKGIAVEVVREAFRQMGDEVTFELYPWARSIEMFKDGQADGIFTFFKNPEREVFTYYSKEPVIVQPITFWTRKDSNIEFKGDLTKLATHKIGVVNQTSYGERIDNAIKSGGIKPDVSDSIKTCIDKLFSNRFDVWISNHYGAVYSLKKAGKFGDVKELTPPIGEIPAYVGFSRKRNLEGLRNDFDKVLVKMKKSGEIDKIYKKYMDSFK